MIDSGGRGICAALPFKVTGSPAPHAGAVSTGEVPASFQVEKVWPAGEPVIFNVTFFDCCVRLTSQTATFAPSFDALAQHRVLRGPSAGPGARPRRVEGGMAGGSGVVGTTTGGTGEILEDGTNGLVFEAGDAAGLAGQIARLAANAELRRHLAEAGQQAVLERFALKRMVGQVEAYLTNVCNGKSTIA